MSKTARKSSGKPAPPTGVWRVFHTAKKALREFAATAAVCGCVVAVMMIAIRIN
jgi:hypothetical protein